MLNQSFSSKTFQEIFDKENRKGKNVEKRFANDFNESLQTLDNIKTLSQLIRNTLNKNARKVLYFERKELKNTRNSQIKTVLEETANRIVNKKEPIELQFGDIFGKQTYKLEESVDLFFLGKKIYENIHKTYNVKPSNRHSVLSELINHLEDRFPKFVIRTDIKNFYESVPQKKLLDKINDDHLLSILTKKFINHAFESYNSLTNQTDKLIAKGLPRGVGFSAYLSELYMRKIDNSIKNLSDCVYYARYVDDIIAIFIPKHTDVDSTYLSNYRIQIEAIINEEELELNTSKTMEYNLLKNISDIRSHTINFQGITNYISNPKYITFLGYNIGSVATYKQNGEVRLENLSIELSEQKIKKYKNRIKLAFLHFNQKKSHNRKVAFKLLNARIDYLTQNTKLRNNKDKVFVGIYYSNCFLNNLKSLEIIQNSLDFYINRAGLSLSEKALLKSYDFKDGFNTKKIKLFPIQNKKYKNHNCKRSDVINRTNKGIVQYGLSEINSIWKK